MKKKGFTLIELLSVIVIFSIISLITVPILINVIKDSKKKSFIESVNFLIDAVELDKITFEYSNLESIYNIENNKLMFNGRNIEHKGSIDGNGYIKISKEGIEAKISNEDYCYVKSFKMKKGHISNNSCIDLENLLVIDENIKFPYKLGDMSIDYNPLEQIFTVNGISSIDSKLNVLSLAIIPLEVKTGEKYTITIIPLNNVNNVGHMNINYELQKTNTWGGNISPRHYTAADIVLTPESYSSSRTMTITGSDEDQTKYVHIYFWINKKVETKINNYKFRVMINKGTNKNWIPSVNA